jgi:hypothetical protein
VLFGHSGNFDGNHRLGANQTAYLAKEPIAAQVARF